MAVPRRNVCGFRCSRSDTAATGRRVDRIGGEKRTGLGAVGSFVRPVLVAERGPYPELAFGPAVVDEPRFDFRFELNSERGGDGWVFATAMATGDASAAFDDRTVGRLGFGVGRAGREPAGVSRGDGSRRAGGAELATLDASVRTGADRRPSRPRSGARRAEPGCGALRGSFRSGAAAPRWALRGFDTMTGADGGDSAPTTGGDFTGGDFTGGDFTGGAWAASASRAATASGGRRNSNELSQ
ncbi:MAG: hypothetical protein ACI9OJ_002623, partial [Myxococcota bacterium]